MAVTDEASRPCLLRPVNREHGHYNKGRVEEKKGYGPHTYLTRYKGKIREILARRRRSGEKSIKTIGLVIEPSL